MQYSVRRKWRVTFLKQDGNACDVLECEVTAHCAWAAAMDAQKQQRIDARDIIIIEEITE